LGDWFPTEVTIFNPGKLLNFNFGKFAIFAEIGYNWKSWKSFSNWGVTDGVLQEFRQFLEQMCT